MSMSEFEGSPQPDYPSSRASQPVGLPADFSEDDRLFAQELEALFCLATEETPPLFAQTLLESNDPRFQAADAWLEHKTHASVFRQLHMKRRIFRSSRPSIASLAQAPLSLRRPFIGLFITCMLIMLMSMVLVAPSFASGLNILLAGPHSGVVQVHDYPLSPSNLTKQQKDASADATDRPRQMSLIEAQRNLKFPFYWPLAIPDNYSLDGIYLYQGVAQKWADGPLVEMEFTLSLPGVAPHGTGKITICEFMPKGKVFQMVQLGSSQQLQIDNGNAAVYVNGQWEQVNNAPGWVYGEAGELIYERDGVIFWIAGDQRDGITKDTLVGLAHSFKSYGTEQMMQIMKHAGIVAESGDDSTGYFAHKVVYIDLPGSSFMSIVGDDTSPGSGTIAQGQVNTN